MRINVLLAVKRELNNSLPTSDVEGGVRRSNQTCPPRI